MNRLRAAASDASTIEKPTPSDCSKSGPVPCQSSRIATYAIAIVTSVNAMVHVVPGARIHHAAATTGIRMSPCSLKPMAISTANSVAAPVRDIFYAPQHPYTQVLMSAIPEADPDVTRKKHPIQLRSMDVPSLLRIPSGCSFHPRCPRFEGIECETVVPQLTRFVDGSVVACHPIRRERALEILHDAQS